MSMKQSITGNSNDKTTKNENRNKLEAIEAEETNINAFKDDCFKIIDISALTDTTKPDNDELPDAGILEKDELIDTTEAMIIRNRKIKRYKIIRTVFSISFILFTALFINEVVIQPYRSNKVIEKTNQLYQNTDNSLSGNSNGDLSGDLNGDLSGDLSGNALTPTTSPVPTIEQSSEETIEGNTDFAKDPIKDDEGRLLKFKELLNVNEDVKGWITIPDTNIDYVVVQSSTNDPEYYLKRNLFKEDDKAGSIFLDHNSSVEDQTQNMVIHGHNMYSTDNMFHYVTEYKNIDFYKARPVFAFDTIYQTGKWKIFAVFITNGTTKKEELFDYTRTDFTSSSDFLNFVYQLRIRSMYFIDDVTINENDQLLTLSTCSYEVKDYRTVVVARKLRPGEDETVDVDSVTENLTPLLPGSYYYRYGGKAPKITNTFEVALDAGEINWYTPPEK